MPRIPYFEIETATGKHAELLGKLNPISTSTACWPTRRPA